MKLNYKSVIINCVRFLHRRNLVSRYLQFENAIPAFSTVEDEHYCTSKSLKLMLSNGIIARSSPGTFFLLPYGVKAMEKLINIIDEEMADIEAHKVDMPILLHASEWRKSGRWETIGSELFKLFDRHNSEYCLGPTHEEAITSLISSSKTISYKQLPVRIYQITKKFRDEINPHHALLRAREFYMKDLYTFDNDYNSALSTYQEVCESYNKIFHRLDLKVIKVQGSTGVIGGSHSHEYHILSEIGEDHILQCSKCNFCVNIELIATQDIAKASNSNYLCPSCKQQLQSAKAIEVGHTFLLDTKYSKIFEATYLDEYGKSQLYKMGCYGLGVTRILAAAVEYLSLPNQIRWPLAIAPFQVCIISPKKGSKEAVATPMVFNIYDMLSDLPHLNGNVIIDDRDLMTIGKRFVKAKQLGYPYVIIAGKRAVDPVPLFEVHDIARNQMALCTHATLYDFFRCHQKQTEEQN